MSLWTKRRNRALRVSAYLPNWTNGLTLGEQPSWAQIGATARSLEELGIDGIWVADQLLQEFDDQEPLAFWESWRQPRSSMTCSAANRARAPEPTTRPMVPVCCRSAPRRS